MEKGLNNLGVVSQKTNMRRQIEVCKLVEDKKVCWMPPIYPFL